jgi:hypothetical protein
VLSPSERIRLIREIARRLDAENWAVVDLTLNQFALPTTTQWEGNLESYVLAMIRDAGSATLIALAEHVGHEVSARMGGPKPAFWADNSFRLFVSHLAQFREFAGQLQEELLRIGISAFVAHTDIEPTSEWQTQIELALSTADAMVALLHEGFHLSNWTDQEIGHAMGRGLLVVTVRLGQDPYGFIGRFQALAGSGRAPKILARELGQVLVRHKQTGLRLTETLVARLEAAQSYVDTLAIVPVLASTTWGTSALGRRCLDAIEKNSQVSGAYGARAEIQNMVSAWT